MIVTTLNVVHICPHATALTSEQAYIKRPKCTLHAHSCSESCTAHTGRGCKLQKFGYGPSRPAAEACWTQQHSRLRSSSPCRAQHQVSTDCPASQLRHPRRRRQLWPAALPQVAQRKLSRARSTPSSCRPALLANPQPLAGSPALLRTPVPTAAPAHPLPASPTAAPAAALPSHSAAHALMPERGCLKPSLGAGGVAVEVLGAAVDAHHRLAQPGGHLRQNFGVVVMRHCLHAMDTQQVSNCSSAAVRDDAQLLP